MLPKILTIQQKDAHENVCAETLSAIKNYLNFLERVVTYDVILVSPYIGRTQLES